MEINWVLLTYIIIGYFAISGFSRGWWKEAITTVVLAILIFLLQNPTWAQTVVNMFNSLIAAVWDMIPGNVLPAVNDGVEAAFAVNTGGGTIQADASDPGTWLVILALLVGGAILFSRTTLGHEPTLLGKVTGALVGGLNGFLLLSLVREYLDGRALPGRSAPATEIAVTGSSSFGPPASGVSIQATNLPGYTILDSVIPWVAVGVGLLFLIAVFKTRVGIATSPDGGKKIEAKYPPFYKKPKPPPKPEPPMVRIVQ